MTEVQQSINRMRARLLVIDEKHDEVTMERGRAVLEYAVRLYRRRASIVH